MPGPMGPIYGALLVEMGRAAPEGPMEPEGLATMLEAGVAVVFTPGTPTREIVDWVNTTVHSAA